MDTIYNGAIEVTSVMFTAAENRAITAWQLLRKQERLSAKLAEVVQEIRDLARG